MPSNWRNVTVDEGTVFSILNRNFLEKPLSLPSFEGSKCLLIGSDYGGESNEEPYRVFSFLFVGKEAWHTWEEKRIALRKEIMPDNRRMAYKRLGDGYRRRFLKPILEAADDLDGLSISIAVSKSAPSLFPSAGPIELQNPDFFEFHNWKGSVLEKTFTVLHFASFLLAGLSHPNQDVFWVSDQDQIAANETMLKSLTKAFAWVASGYLAINLGYLRCATTACDRGDCQMEDFVSIPDLIAGSLSEQFRSSGALGIANNKIMWISGAGMKEKAQSILFWYASRQQRLKKHVIVLDPGDHTSHKVSWFNFTH